MSHWRWRLWRWRWRAAGLVAALAFVAITLMPGGSGDDETAQLPASDLCNLVREEAESFAREVPEQGAEARANAEEICEQELEDAPAPTPAPDVSPSPTPGVSRGCNSLDKVKPVPGAWRRAGPVPGSAPFFAPQAGAPPRSGTPNVGGIELPRGSRCPRHWATDRPIADALELAARLAEKFPETGLWPVVWEWEEDPDAYLGSFSGDPRATAGLDAGAVLRRLAKRYRVDFAGLAPSSPLGAEEIISDPFGSLARLRVVASPTPTSSYLVLVPAHRPAEVMSVVGFGGTEILRDAELAAILMSWEDRFQAVLTALGPGLLTLVVGAPPETEEDALRLADEQVLFAPDDGESQGDLGGLATRLRSGEPLPDARSKHIWAFGWPD